MHRAPPVPPRLFIFCACTCCEPIAHLTQESAPPDATITATRRRRGESRRPCNGKAEQRARIWHGRAVSIIPKIERADIAFLDPPYPLEQEYERSLMALADEPPGLVIVQHSSRFALGEEYGALKRVRVLKQGDNTLSFFE